MISGDGNVLVAATAATLTSVNTTLGAALSIGDTAITVAAGTNIAAGDTLLIGALVEPVIVRSITGTAVVSRRPLVNDHANGAAVVSSKLTHAFTAANCATKFWDGRLRWVIDTNTVVYQDAICTEYAFWRAASIDSLWDEDSKLGDVVDDEMDLDRLLDDALGDVVRKVNSATNGRAWTYTGPNQFEDATVFAAMIRIYRSRPGDVNGQMLDRYKGFLATELDLIVGTAPRDADQDAVIEEHEQVRYRSHALRR